MVVGAEEEEEEAGHEDEDFRVSLSTNSAVLKILLRFCEKSLLKRRKNYNSRIR